LGRVIGHSSLPVINQENETSRLEFFIVINIMKNSIQEEEAFLLQKHGVSSGSSLVQFDLSNLPMEYVIEHEENDFTIYRSAHPRYGYIVVKMETATRKYPNAIHEAFIGQMGLSGLRNFAPVYGLNLRDRRHQPVGMEYKSYHAVIYKYIPGPTLREYITGTYPEIPPIPQGFVTIRRSSDVMKRILLSVLLALHQAWSKFSFTHYDAHLRNIILTRNETKIPLEYKGNVLLMTSIVPVFIDYDSCFMCIDGKSYGRTLKRGAIENRSFWVHDVIKILISIYVLTCYEYRKITLLSDKIDRFNHRVHTYLQSHWDKSADDIIKLFTSQRDHDGIPEKLKEIEAIRNTVEEIYHNQIQALDHNRLFYDPITIYITRLLSFFFPSIPSNQLSLFIRQYHDSHPYFETQRTPENESLSFDEFIDFAVTLLN
jgi:hypothetical protein